MARFIETAYSEVLVSGGGDGRILLWKIDPARGGLITSICALEDGREEKEAKNVGWVPRVFAPVMDQLAFVASHNLTLKNYMGPLLKAIADGGA